MLIIMLFKAVKVELTKYIVCQTVIPAKFELFSFI